MRSVGAVGGHRDGIGRGHDGRLVLWITRSTLAHRVAALGSATVMNTLWLERIALLNGVKRTTENANLQGNHGGTGEHGEHRGNPVFCLCVLARSLFLPVSPVAPRVPVVALIVSQANVHFSPSFTPLTVARKKFGRDAAGLDIHDVDPHASPCFHREIPRLI